MTQSEKDSGHYAEIITLVKQSPLSVKATLKELGINGSTFYECRAADTGDYSNCILAWELCSYMQATDMGRTMQAALKASSLKSRQRLHMLSDKWVDLRVWISEAIFKKRKH